MLFPREAGLVLALAALYLLLAGRAPASLPTSPSSPDALSYNQSGSDKYAKGDLDGAISDYDQAILLNPKLAKAYYNRGLAKYDKGALAEAVADYDQAIKLNPKYEDAYVNRGLAKDDLNNADGAIADDTTAI